MDKLTRLYTLHKLLRNRRRHGPQAPARVPRMRGDERNRQL